MAAYQQPIYQNGIPMVLAPQYAAQVPALQQPQVQQQAQSATSTPTIQNNGAITWCQGIAGAQAYPVMPGQSVMLLDAEPSSHSFYIKSVDVSGMPMPLRIFDYKERTQEQNEGQEGVSNPAPSETVDYASMIKAVEERVDEIAEIQERIIEKIKSEDKEETKREKESAEEKEKLEAKRRAKYDF